MEQELKPKTSKIPKAKSVKPKAEKKVVASDLSITLYGLDGSQSKTIELPALFNEEAHPLLIAQYMRVYMANQRRGTASTKTRSEVIGTTKKVYRQKGTGGARHGSRKANVFKGGGVTFGPKPTDYSLKMNKKQKRKALLGALSLKAKEHDIVGLTDEFLTMEPKTKMVAQLMKKLAFDGNKTLIIIPNADNKKGILLAARNMPNVTLSTAAQINPYIILNNKKIAFVESALGVVANHFGEKNEK